MPRRFFFSAPDLSVAVGGVFVIYEFVRTLRSAGYEAFVLHNSPKFSHPDLGGDAVVRHSFVLREALLGLCGWRWRLVLRAKLLWDGIFGARRGRETPGSEDVLVLPEVSLNLLPHLQTKATLALLTQNHFTHLRMLGRAPDPADQAAIAAMPTIATSEAARDVAASAGAEDVRFVPLHIDGARFRFRGEKKPSIAYMPRRNADDAKTIIDMLRSRGKVDGFDFIAIDHATRDEVAAQLGDALIFLALSEREGFGLPPAEAMASGCVVIGYVGHGGAEFFDDSTGFPVREGDLMSFVETIEAVVAEYRGDPARLDRFRKAASEKILGKYSLEAMQAALLSTWRGLFGAPDGEARSAAA